ncbi:MAG: ATP-binding protein [Acidobacteria bacterium]|nr:ATP-binding protein [Acidobacteriota bacterium]
MTPDADLTHDRPSVATIPWRRSLRVRVAVFVAVSVAAVISVTTYVELRQFERVVESDIREAGRLTAMAVADDLELREGPLQPDGLARYLHEFIDAAPEIRSVSVVTMNGNVPSLFASTSAAPADQVLEAARVAFERRDLVWGSEAGAVRILATPLKRDGRLFGSIAVSVSFASLDRLRTTGRALAFWATLVAWAILFILIELLARSFILRPIHRIHETMREAGEGRMSVRVPVRRQDELGAVSVGLNQMLVQIETLHGSLNRRVTEATNELQARNRELVEMYQQMFLLREQLGRAQQLAAVGETASVVAHQVGTPLNLISGHIQVLIEEQGPESPITRRLQVAEEQIRKVTATVRGLLARSRHALERETVDLAALIRRVCTLVQPALEPAGVALALDCEEVPGVQADAVQLELALLNLISNALDAMPSGGRLTVSVRALAASVAIEIGDTGSGIDPDLIDRIFDPWVTTKAEGRGTGLGLSITRSVVTEHGGTIRVRTTPGTGSVFTVELPIGAPAVQ